MCVKVVPQKVLQQYYYNLTKGKNCKHFISMKNKLISPGWLFGLMARRHPTIANFGTLFHFNCAVCVRPSALAVQWMDVSTVLLVSILWSSFVAFVHLQQDSVSILWVPWPTAQDNVTISLYCITSLNYTAPQVSAAMVAFQHGWCMDRPARFTPSDWSELPYIGSNLVHTHSCVHLPIKRQCFSEQLAQGSWDSRDLHAYFSTPSPSIVVKMITCLVWSAHYVKSQDWPVSKGQSLTQPSSQHLWVCVKFIKSEA